MDPTVDQNYPLICSMVFRSFTEKAKVFNVLLKSTKISVGGYGNRAIKYAITEKKSEYFIRKLCEHPDVDPSVDNNFCLAEAWKQVSMKWLSC